MVEFSIGNYFVSYWGYLKVIFGKWKVNIFKYEIVKGI